MFNLPNIKLCKLDKLRKRIAAFVTQRYCTTEDVIRLRWLPSKEQIEFDMLKLAHKAIYNEDFPSYLKNFRLRAARRCTRNGEATQQYETSCSEKLFTGKASRLLNDIPKEIREIIDHKEFCRKLRNYLLDKSLASYLSNH